MCQFQWGLNEIKKVIGDHVILVNFWVQEIVTLKVEVGQDENDVGR